MGVSAEDVRSTALSVLKHPLAVQVLTVCNEERMSPSTFVEERYRPRPATEKEFKNSLSQVSYHFRCLEKAGLLELVDMIPRRGAFERVYSGTARAHFSDEEWAKVPEDERRRISTVTWQGLMARVESAMLGDSFDDRDDRWMAWTAGRLDERGWAEMVSVIAANYAKLEAIREDAEARLEETGEEPINATFGMMGFESPDSLKQT
jgi:DNA-binding transcriptional ArsR family regulator